MAEKLRWTSAAARDLEEIADYICRDSPSYAAAFVEKILAAAASIPDWPESGSIVPEFDDSSVREVFVRPYRLIYQTRGEVACILAIIHGARDLLGSWNVSERRP
jgi:addiction module RelE/StbE family toxin